MDEQFQSIDGCYIMSILDKKRPKTILVQFPWQPLPNLYRYNSIIIMSKSVSNMKLILFLFLFWLTKIL